MKSRTQDNPGWSPTEHSSNRIASTRNPAQDTTTLTAHRAHAHCIMLLLMVNAKCKFDNQAFHSNHNRPI
jgi:hypothetical protein